MAEQTDDAKARAGFAVLRPVCVEVMRAPSLETLRALDDVIAGLPSLHPHLVDYVVLPLKMITKKTGGSNMRLLEATLDSLALIFSRVQLLENWKLFEELFMFMCMLLDSKMAAQAGYSCSEDLVLSVSKALRSLLLSAAESVRLQLYSHLPAVGHCVCVLLDTLQSHLSKAVRKVGLGALLALSGVNSEKVMECTGPAHSDSLDTTHSLKAIVECVGTGRGGGVFASFLPGIAMTLSTLVTTDAKVGQSGIALTVMTWAHYASLVMADRDTDKTQPHTQPPTTTDKKPLAIDRTPTWRRETDHKLSILVHRISSLVSHESWRVRLTMVHWAHCLLTHCHRTLVTCMPTVIEVLVTLMHDGYKQVSTSAQLALEMFSKQYAKEGSHQLTSVLEERLHSLASALPRLMRQHDETRKLSTLQLLAGYLLLLGPHVVSLVNSHSHLSRLTQALIQTLKLDVGDMRILETLPGEEDDHWRLPLRYQHFRSERMETLLHHICQLLGFYGSLPVLLDHLMDMFQVSSLYQKELLIVLSHVLLGAGGLGCAEELGEPPHGVNQEEMFSLVEGVLEELLSPSSWQQPWQEDSNDPGSSSPQDPTTLLSCLLLNMVTACIKIIGRQFDRLVQLAIYPLMQRLGHRSPLVSSHALATLRTVCSYCGYSSLQQLITHNADYLVNSVALQLRSRATKNPVALQVLQAVLKHGNAEVLPLMQDSIDELLFSLDMREDPNLLWPALHTLMVATARWGSEEVPLPSQASSIPPPSPSSTHKISPEISRHLEPGEVGEFFLEYHRSKERERWTEMGGEGEEEASAEMEEEDNTQKKKLPPPHQAAVDVMQRCTHHLSTPSPSLRLTILDALGHCLATLRDDQATLYMEVHKVWPALLHRLSDSAPAVALKAWEVLLVMCDVCRDFLRKRVVQKVCPPLSTSLENLTSRSRHADKLYRQTADFKLQRKLLECVGTLCEKLDVSSSDSEHLVYSCIPYLSVEQPAELQQSCKTCLTTLVRRDPDGMWLLLQQLQPEGVVMPPHSQPKGVVMPPHSQPEGVVMPPHSSLKPYKFTTFPTASSFAGNVQPLLQLTV